MKYRFLLVFILLINLNGYSQEDSKYFVGLEGISTTKGVFAYTLGGVIIKKIKLQSGILIGSDYVNNKFVFGLQADILYYPNQENEKTFNLFFISSINYFNNKTILNTSIIDINTIQITFGYGFDYNITNNLSFKSNLGLGSLLEIRKFNFDTYSPKNKWGFAGIISIGFKYDL